MRNENTKLVLKMLLMLAIIFLTIKFFIFIFPIILVLMVIYLIYNYVIKTKNRTKDNVKKTGNHKKINKDVQEAEVVKERNE